MARESDTIGPLVESHREFLRFLEQRTGSRAVAEDILQDAFVRGLTKVAALRDKESVIAWFYRVLRNAVIDHRRRTKAADTALAAFATEAERSSEAPRDVQGAICQCVAHLTGALKPEYAQALRAVEVEGQSVKEFATGAGISASNAGVRIFRAREALRRQVLRSCGACAEHGCVDCSCTAQKPDRPGGSHHTQARFG